LESFHVATFHSVSQALRFEKLLQQRELQVKMIPVPRIISSSCGIAARFADEELPRVKALLIKGEAEAERVYHLTYPNKKLRAEQITDLGEREL
jgi:hypothetical protein